MRLQFPKYIVSSFLTNSLWVILGTFISKGISFVSITLIARILGPEFFGEYNVVQATIGIFGSVAGLGFGLAATKLISEWRQKDIRKTERIIGSLYLLSFLISLAVAIIFLLSSSWIANNLLDNKRLTILLQISCLIVIFDSINGVQNGVLSGFEAFKEITVIGTIVGIVSAPLLVAGAHFYGLTGLAAMLLLTRFINVYINSIYLKNKIFKTHDLKVKLRINNDVLKSVFGIGIPSFLGSLSTSATSWISTTIFVNHPSGYTSLGTYNAANQLRTLVLFLPDSVGKVTIPQMSNAYGNGDVKRFKSTVVLTLFWNLLLSVFVAIVVYFFGNLFQQYIGLEFEINNSLLITVLLTGVLIAVNNAIGYILICSNLIWYDFLSRIFWGIALILLILFYGRYNGAIGYGISLLGASIIHMITQIVILLVKLKNESALPIED